MHCPDFTNFPLFRNLMSRYMSAEDPESLLSIVQGSDGVTRPGPLYRARLFPTDPGISNPISDPDNLRVFCQTQERCQENRQAFLQLRAYGYNDRITLSSESHPVVLHPQSSHTMSSPQQQPAPEDVIGCQAALFEWAESFDTKVSSILPVYLDRS